MPEMSSAGTYASRLAGGEVTRVAARVDAACEMRGCDSHTVTVDQDLPLATFPEEVDDSALALTPSRTEPSRTESAARRQW